MSEVLTVPTAFGDISEMAQGLVDRVDEQQIILYGPSGYEEGSELGFALLLLDGSTALEGRGVVAASVDGGEDRDPSTRFDIILQSLQFDGVAEVVFERMVMARLQTVGDEPADVGKSTPPPAFDELASQEADAFAAEAPAEEAVAEPPAEEPPVEEPPAEEPAAFDFGGFDNESTVVAGIEHEQMIAASVAAAEPAYEPPPAAYEPPPAAYEPPPAADPEPAAAAEPRSSWDDEPAEPPAEQAMDARPSQGSASAPQGRVFEQKRDLDSLYPTGADLPIRPGAPAPEPPAPPSGFAIDNSLAGGLVRPHTVWSPVAPPMPEPRPSSGLFQYGPGPIPIPQRPPRPDLDPSYRVDRAPAPIREGELRSDAPPARPQRPRRVEFDDAMMADAIDLDPVSADD